MLEVLILPPTLPHDLDNLVGAASDCHSGQQPDDFTSRAAPEGGPAQVAGVNRSLAPPCSAGEHWLAENQAALQSSNEFVSRCGLPLGRFRAF